MNVEGGFLREVSQEFSDETKFRMRIMEEHADTKWSPAVGVCVTQPPSEAKACMQYARIPDIGPGFWAIFYYLTNNKAPRQQNVILVDHRAVVGETINVSIKQKSEQLIFTIEGIDEVFPVPFKAAALVYVCSSAICEFRD